MSCQATPPSPPESDEKYRVLFQNMTEGFALYELVFDEGGTPVDWRVLEVNDAYVRHTGLARERIVGRRISEVYAPAVPEYLSRFVAVVATQTSLEFETYATLVGRHVHVVTFPAGGTRFASVIEDITERKHAEQALRASEERLRLVLEASAMGTFEVDLVTGEGTWNAVEFELLGLAPGSIQPDPETFFRFVHPADVAALREQWAEALRCGTLDAEFRVVRGDGSVRWLAGRGRFVYEGQGALDATGRAVRFLGVNFDITERKQADAAVRESREDLNRAQAVAHTGSWRLDVHRNQLLWSDENWRIFGVAQGTPLTYETFLGIVHPDDRDLVHQAWSAALRGEPYDLEHRIVVDGQVKWVRERAEIEVDDAGNTLGGFGTTQDVTARKQAEVQIQASLAEKEVLLKEVHHRVKNNLQIISSLVSLQTEGQADPALRVLLGDVRDRVRTMALVHEKLYESADLSGVEFAGYAKSLLHYLWRAHGQAAAAVRLTLDLAPVAFTVQVAVPCGLILNELVTNALKHAFPGRTGGEVTVTLRADDAGRVRLLVRDDGVGLPAGVDLPRSRSLGLRLVRMLAAQLEGALVCRAADGGGAEFEVSFPRGRLAGG